MNQSPINSKKYWLSLIIMSLILAFCTLEALEVEITSSPAGAKIYIKGPMDTSWIYQGDAPMTASFRMEGYQVKAVYGGNSQVKTVNEDSGALQFVFEKQPGSIIIYPPAEIAASCKKAYLDGSAINLPFSGTVKEGSHTISAVNDIYEIPTKSVYIASGEQKSIRLTAIEKGSLDITSFPIGATIKLFQHGRELGSDKTPTRFPHLNSGDYEIKLFLSGYCDTRSTATVHAAQLTKVKVTLILRADLEVITRSAEAKVIIWKSNDESYKKTGQTRKTSEGSGKITFQQLETNDQGKEYRIKVIEPGVPIYQDTVTLHTGHNRKVITTVTTTTSTTSSTTTIPTSSTTTTSSITTSINPNATPSQTSLPTSSPTTTHTAPSPSSPLIPPQKLSAKVSDQNLWLSWNDKNPNHTGYYISYSNSNNPEKQTVFYEKSGPGPVTEKYLLKNLTDGNYNFKVCTTYEAAISPAAECEASIGNPDNDRSPEFRVSVYQLDNKVCLYLKYPGTADSRFVVRRKNPNGEFLPLNINFSPSKDYTSWTGYDSEAKWFPFGNTYSYVIYPQNQEPQVKTIYTVDMSPPAWFWLLALSLPFGLITLIVILIHILTKPNSEISGEVRDSTTNNMVAADIVLNGARSVKITTDLKKGYKLGKLPAGSYHLTFSAPNYAPEMQNISLASGEKITLNIQLNIVDTAKKYKVVGLLGVGGMAIVLKVEKNSTGEQFALKFPFFFVGAEDNKFIEDFVKEASLAKFFQHPNIVKVYDAGENLLKDTDISSYKLVQEHKNGSKEPAWKIVREPGNWQESTPIPYMLMECLEGAILDRLPETPLIQTVKDLVILVQPETKKFFKPEQVATIIEQILMALIFMHGVKIRDKQGYIHGDIKPNNIMLASDGKTFKIVDHGIAKPIDFEKTATYLKGTFKYMAPELLKEPPEKTSPQSDLYALGCVFYELLTGSKYFDKKQTAIQEIQKINPWIKEPLIKILNAMLHDNPKRRFKSAGACLHTLDKWIHGIEEDLNEEIQILNGFEEEGALIKTQESETKSSSDAGEPAKIKKSKRRNSR